MSEPGTLSPISPALPSLPFAISFSLLAEIMPTMTPARAEIYSQPLMEACSRWEIFSRRRVAPFLAQLAVESSELRVLRENLLYSAARLPVVFGRRRFPEGSDMAERYARKPQAIANYVYANRFGNGDEASGDGWRYRGGGLIQLTFLDNYRRAQEATGLPLVEHPELLEQPGPAAMTAAWYWSSHGCNQLAEMGHFEAITRAINPAMQDAERRHAYYARALHALGLVQA